MNTDHDYLIDADHVHPDYQFRRTTVRVHTRSDGSFATHPKLGCGKTYDSEWAAIIGLFSDHACTNIQVSDPQRKDIMGTYDTRGGSPLSPKDEEPPSTEFELTRQQWQIICGAVMLLAMDARGSDAEVVKALAEQLEKLKTGSGAYITVWE
jgi:hypothetical protein